MWTERVLNFFGSLVCHQIEERTIFINGIPLPVCSRDTGIYLGIIAGMLFVSIKRRWDADKPPDLKYAIILCLMALPMMLDGAASYLGLWKTDNLLRIITGGLFGLPIILFLTGLNNFKIYEVNSKSVLRSWRELIILNTVTLSFLILVYKGMIFNWYFIAVLIVIGMLFLFYRLSSAVVSLFVCFTSRHRKIAEAFLFCLVLCAIYILDRLFIWPLKKFL